MTDTSNWQQATDNANAQNVQNVQNVEVVLPPQMRTDLRLLLDHLETEYVGPNIAQAMRRLRVIVGFGN
jgi:hypothetical protein